jgi:hypothetical protein
VKPWVFIFWFALDQTLTNPDLFHSTVSPSLNKVMRWRVLGKPFACAELLGKNLADVTGAFLEGFHRATHLLKNGEVKVGVGLGPPFHLIYWPCLKPEFSFDKVAHSSLKSNFIGLSSDVVKEYNQCNSRS